MIDEYLNLGWNILPAPIGSKHPAIPWQEYQKRKITAEEIKLMFAEQSNIVVITGQISNNLLVIDIDKYKNPKLLEWFTDKIQEIGLDINNIPHSETARGGLHFFFHTEEPVSCAPIKYKDIMIDIRGEGGLIVLPPSQFNGNQYKWIVKPTKENIPFLDLDKINKLGLTIYGVEVYTGISSINSEDEGEYANLIRNYINNSNNIIPEGMRNTVLTRIIGLLISKGLEKSAIHTIVKEINKIKCKPPLPERDIYTIVKGVWKTFINKGIKISHEVDKKIKESIEKCQKEGIVFNNLIRIESQPPEYMLSFSREGATYTVRLKDKELIKWQDVRVAVMNQTNILITELNHTQWNYILRGLLQRVQVEKPQPLSDEKSILVDAIYSFVNRKIEECKKVYQGEKGSLEVMIQKYRKVYYDGSYLYFYTQDLMKYLEFQQISIGRNKLITYINNLGGGIKTVKIYTTSITVAYIDVSLVEKEWNRIINQ